MRSAVWPALLSVLLFAHGLGGGFIYDDEPMLVENDRVVKATVREALTSDYWGYHEAKDWHYIHYRPLAILSFSGLHHLFGLSPFAFHAANFLMNAVAIACFYWLLLALGQSATVAMAAALLFAVHPLHVESVEWVIGLTETQSGALTIASLTCFAYGKRAWSWLLAGLAMFTKESALILPAIIFVLAWMHCPERKKWRAPIEASMPYAVLAALYVAVRGILLPHPPPGAVSASILGGLRTMPRVAAQYLEMLFVPWPLAIHYALAGRELVLGVLFVAGSLVLVAIYVKSTRDDLALSAALILFPILMPVLTSPLRDGWLYIQDRLTYLSTAGACLLAATMLARLPRRGLLYACMLLVPLGALGTYLQVDVWDNNETFWRHTLKVTPQSNLAALNLAYSLYLDERFSEAAQVYIEALRYHPDDKDLLQSLAAMRGGHPVGRLR